MTLWKMGTLLSTLPVSMAICHVSSYWWKGANSEVQHEDGAIPLHDACAGGFVEIVQLLINSANDRNCVKRMLESVDAEGDTPLHHAARGERTTVIRLLLASGHLPPSKIHTGRPQLNLPIPGRRPGRFWKLPLPTWRWRCGVSRLHIIGA